MNVIECGSDRERRFLICLDGCIFLPTIGFVIALRLKGSSLLLVEYVSLKVTPHREWTIRALLIYKGYAQTHYRQAESETWD